VSRLALGAHAAIELAADKFRTIGLARELRIPWPETVLVSSTDDVRRAAAKWDCVPSNFGNHSNNRKIVLSVCNRRCF
jgi:hypothetical protein